MNLKQHNNIVDKLLAQLEKKQKQIKQLNKQILKQRKCEQQSQSKTLKSTTSVQTQKLIQKRISQLNKQHTNKINQLNQQIKTLTQQNKDLIERVNLKNNIDMKQKDHIVEVMKKNFDRKAGTPYDHKVAALISHYQDEINKKNNYIQTLKRQIKSLSLNVNNGKNVNTNNTSSNIVQNNNKNTQQQANNYDSQNNQQSLSHFKYQQQIKKLQSLNEKLKKNLYDKNNQTKQLKQRYNELTQQYYRIINQYGVQSDFQKQQFTKKKQTTQNLLKNPKFTPVNKNKSNPLSNILQDVCIQNQPNSSISVDFEQKFKKFNNQPKFNEQTSYNEQESLNYSDLKQQDFTDEQDQQTNQQNKITMKKPFKNNNQTKIQQSQSFHQDLLEQIRSLLHLNSFSDIIPYLTNLMIKLNDLQLHDEIFKKLHSFYYKFGMGKVSKNDMIETLQIFQEKVNKWIENSDLLDQICIQIGAKKGKLIKKITEMKNIQSEYLQKMRNVQFLIQLKKSHKLLQFINFFELDKSQLQLPQQLKNIYQQLKYVDKFMKQANMTLGIQLKQNKKLQDTLQIILRKLQSYADWQYEMSKIKQQKAAKKLNKKNEQN